MKLRKLQFRQKLQSKGGFTLVELIVVLVIMGILTGAIIPTVTGYVADARDEVSKSNQAMVEQAARLYLTDWESDINASDLKNLTVQDLVDKGYLSNNGGMADATITFAESNGHYTVKVSKASGEGADE